MKKKRIEFDFSRLIGRIVEKYGSRTNFAKAANIKPNILSSRLHNKTNFTPEEVVRYSSPDMLDIPGELIHVYFYTPKF